MATMEVLTAPPSGAVEAGGGGGGGAAPPDNTVLHPYIYPHVPLKLPVKGKPLRKQLAKLLTENEKEGGAWLDAVDAARAELGSALESVAVSDASVSDAANKYIGLLLGMTSSFAGSGGGATVGAAAGSAADGASAGATSPDEALAAAEAGAGASSSPLSAPASKLRHAAQWQWSEALFSPAPGAQPPVTAQSDAVFELASTLVAYAVRLMHAAAKACEDTASGVAGPAATRAYKASLLREASGVLELVLRDTLPSLPAGISADCDRQAISGLATLALADAQQLTLLRAVAKGNQPQLIAAISADTAALFSQAGSQVAAAPVPGASGSKLAAYCAYKAAYCSAYAHCFNGICLWKQQEKAGDGLKSVQAGMDALAAARKASSAYDAAPPASLNLHHRRVDEDLEHVLLDTQRRMQRENDSVYLQRIATETPQLPEGKRLVSALPYTLPPAAAAVKDGVVERCFAAGPTPTAAPGVMAMSAGGAAAGAGQAGTEGGKAEEGCSCCRWTVFLVTAPILAVLWLVGAAIWLLLLPLKCCCPCCGVPLGWAASLVLWLLRLPARGLRMAVGSPWEDGEDEKKKKEEERKKEEKK